MLTRRARAASSSRRRSPNLRHHRGRPCRRRLRLRRASVYEPATGMAGLRTVPISRCRHQRAGMRRPPAPGTAYRLHEGESRTLKELTQPAIAAADPGLSRCSSPRGHADADAVGALPWLTPPPAPVLQRAHELLVSLGALTNASSELQATPYASELAELPSTSAAHRSAAPPTAPNARLRLAARRRRCSPSETFSRAAAARTAPTCGCDCARCSRRGRRPRRRRRRGGARGARCRPPRRVEEAIRGGGGGGDGRRELDVLPPSSSRAPSSTASFSGSRGSATWSPNGRGAARRERRSQRGRVPVAPSLDGGDKRVARMAAAPTATRRRALDVHVADEILVVPSDGSVRRRRVERIGAIVLSSEPLPAPSAAEAPHLLAETAARARYGPRQARHAGGRGDGRAVGRRAAAPCNPTRMAGVERGRAGGGCRGVAARGGSEGRSPQCAASKGIARLLEALSPTRHARRTGADAPADAGRAEGGAGGAPAGDVFAEELEEGRSAQTPRVARHRRDADGGPPGRYLPVTLEFVAAERPVARTSDLKSFWAGRTPG